jgi:hypothetical protein
MRNLAAALAASIVSLLLIAAPALAQQQAGLSSSSGGPQRYSGMGWAREHVCDLLFVPDGRLTASCYIDRSRSPSEWTAPILSTSGTISPDSEGIYRLYYPDRAMAYNGGGGPSYEEFAPTATAYQWSFYSSGARARTKVGVILRAAQAGK